MWKCPKCGETVEDDFDACWKCQRPKDGTETQVEGTGKISRNRVEDDKPQAELTSSVSTPTTAEGMLVRDIALLESKSALDADGK